MNKQSTSNLVLVAILSGLSLLLELFVHFPVLGAAPYLLYSPGDLPMILASVLINPWAGVTAAFINSSLFVILTGEGGPWGGLMHFISSGGMALIIGLISRKEGPFRFAMPAGVITRIALMIPLNLIITPIYTGLARSIVATMIVPVIIPFNIIHAGINTVLTVILLKALPQKYTGLVR